MKKYFRFLVIFFALSCFVPHIVADTLQLYWLNGDRHQISRIPLDNVAPENIEIVLSGLEGFPRSLAIDAANGQMYWTQETTGRGHILLRANLDGTERQSIILNPKRLEGFTLDSISQKMYWSEQTSVQGQEDPLFVPPYLIRRANLDGTNTKTVVVKDAEDLGDTFAEEIAVDLAGGKLYWRSTYYIYRANLNGTNIEEIFSGSGSSGVLYAFALDTVNRKLYTTGENLIRRANLDGTNIEIIATGLGIPVDLVLDVAGGSMYWLEYLFPQAGGRQFKIQCANLDGGNIRTLISGGSELITDIALSRPPSEPVSQEPTVPAPQETEEIPPEPEFTPSVITAGQITFSELMFATSEGLFSQPQWIELFNNGPVGSEPVNLRGLRLVIEARDSETRHRHSTIVFEDLHIKPKWTVLLVTRDNSRNSGYLSEDRVYSLNDHSNIVSLGLRDNAVLPAAGFSLKLFAADGTLIDSAGNLDGVKRSKDTPLWDLPPGWTEDRARTSLIRRYEDGMALPGIEAMSWLRAADVQITTNTYYGHKADIGNPGYRSGGPLPVVLSHFGANRTDAGVSIEWTTESETDNAGFNILRGQTNGGSFVKVNPTLIPGAGTTAERTNYTWVDMTAKPNVAYYYRIEDVSFSGNRQPLATVRMKGHVSASDKLATTWSELKVQD